MVVGPLHEAKNGLRVTGSPRKVVSRSPHATLCGSQVAAEVAAAVEVTLLGAWRRVDAAFGEPVDEWFGELAELGAGDVVVAKREGGACRAWTVRVSMVSRRCRVVVELPVFHWVQVSMVSMSRSMPASCWSVRWVRSGDGPAARSCRRVAVVWR